ncbi:LOXL4-like protein [Mya arenaria]|uniref:LOXL4-like protein n=1 Tax=Mya arenaria TaxID=6604 RepID=A0ABY7G7P9_MYAAR|nr:LOXL4-like protein [Mya arenaria]
MFRCYLSLVWMFSVFLLVEGLIIEDVRLSGTRVPSEGLLEAKVNGTWGAVRYISRYNWRDPLDDLMCRTFGYVNESVMQPRYYGTPHAAFTIRRCPVDMTSLQMLNTSSLQLVDGPSPLEGRLEAGLFGQLQVVYGRSFDLKAANVTCTSLGYRGVRSCNTSMQYGARKLPLYTRNIQCTGTELSLEQCYHSGDYAASRTPANVVSVACDDYTLENISLSTSGVIQVGVNGQLWAVCDAYFTPETANSVCTVLGFNGTSSIDVKTTGDTSDIEILGSIICKPNATSVIDCHIKHQFSYRPYDRSAECRSYIMLTCN